MRLASTFSLLLLMVGVACAGQYGDLSAKANAAKSDQAVLDVVSSSPLSKDPEVQAILAESGQEDAARQLRSLLALRARVEGDAPQTAASAAAEAKAIKASPFYRDPGVAEDSNWLSRALERLRNIRFNRPNAPNLGLPSMALGGWLYILMWVLIAAVLGFLIYLGVKHIRWQRRLARKASAMLEADEPERTLDEWLAEADNLESQGKYREAVRALYLACLLRFDEARIARFHRGQTNWEHLHRIEASPLLPANIEFRTPTQRFDRVWYGRIVKGKEDVIAFREWYLSITAALKGRPS